MGTAMSQALARIELMKDINPDSIHWEMFKNDCMEKEKEQIELPSDEEMKQKANEYTIDDDTYYSFINGAKWMKKQILNQNK